MKIHPLFSSALFCFSSLPLLVHASNDKIDLVVVAERTDRGRTSDTPVAPLTYVSFDGGYIEAGQPIAGERPPVAAAVAAAFHAALGAQGHARAAAPTVALVYHWGMIRPESFPMRIPFRLEPNFRSRLSLVTPAHQLESVEQRIIARKDYPATLGNMMQISSERDAVDLARDARYFVVVSAYDYAALQQREAKLVWRAKLSAATTSGAMNTVIPALLHGGSGFFGRDLAQRTFTSATFPSDVATSSAVSPAPTGLDPAFLNTLLQTERRELSGEHAGSQKHRVSTQRTNASIHRAPAPRI